MRCRRLIVYFAAFLLHRSHDRFTGQARRLADEWLTAIDVSVARAMDMLHWLTSAVRAAVKRDRVSYLQGLVNNISLHDLRQPGSCMGPFPDARSSRRSALQPLPAVQLADGELATLPVEKRVGLSISLTRKQARLLL